MKIKEKMKRSSESDHGLLVAKKHVPRNDLEQQFTVFDVLQLPNQRVILQGSPCSVSLCDANTRPPATDTTISIK
jgi:hypothetical protein